MAIDWDTNGVFNTLGKAVKEAEADSTNNNAMLSQGISFIRNYLLYNFKILAELTESQFDDIWLKLREKMEDDSETINGNAVTAGSVSFTGAGTGTIEDLDGTEDQVNATQMALDGDVFSIKCTSQGGTSANFSVTTMRRGLVASSILPGVVHGDPDADTDTSGIAFQINAPTASITTNPQSLLTSFGVTGGIKNTNCDADGKVWGGYSQTGDDGTCLLYPTESDRDGTTNLVGVFYFDQDGSSETATVTAQNSSGLGGSVGIAASSVDMDGSTMDALLSINFAVGDEFRVEAATVSDDGVFQTFFRDNLSKTLPFDTTGSETISDTLAE